MPLLLYIHGFLSSPASLKARQTQAWCQQNDIDFKCPALPAYPQQAITLLETVIDQWRQQSNNAPIMLVGSSLGGFYATYLAEKYCLRAVLINPAVNPARLIKNYLHQPLQNYHSDEIYVLQETHYEEILALEVTEISHPENLWLMVQTEDETLDYRAAVRHYSRSPQLVESGGDHSFQNYEQWLPRIAEFLKNA